MLSFNRYLLRQLIFAAIFITLALTAALWLTQSLQLIDYMVNRGLPASRFLELTLLLLPGFLGVVLPIATVVGVLFVYHKMIHDSEIVVMRASGASPMQLAGPALLLATLSTAVVYAIALYFLPLSFRNFKDLQIDYRENYAAVLIQEGIFNTIGDNFTVYVRERDSEGALVGIMVHDTRDKLRPATLLAERGAIVRTEEGARVLLVNGNRQEVDHDSGRLSMLYFDQYTVDLDALRDDNPDSRTRKPEERFLHELFFPTAEDRENPRRVKELYAEAHSRLATPLYTFTFTLIGLAALLTGDFSRRGRPRRLVVAGASVALLQGFALAAEDLVNRSSEAAPLMYVGPLVPIVVCVVLLSRRTTSLRRGQSQATGAAA